MPLRKVINQNFLALAMMVGMDSAILNPTDRDMMATLLATEALLGRDKFCRKFANAYRKNKIGPLQEVQST
jgi:5-methyltetrahydrofolate corrinoid/iron sulfur protein methyltransferase